MYFLRVARLRCCTGVLITALFLSACSVPLVSSVPLVIRERGTQLTGNGIANKGRDGGTMNVTLDNKVYRGRWQMAAIASTGTASSIGGKPITVVGSQVTTSGNAQAVLWSEDGDTLHCVLVLGRNSGIGTCQDSRGRIFDLVGGDL